MSENKLDDFETADLEAGADLMSPPPAGLIVDANKHEPTSLTTAPKDVLELRKNLVREYHGGNTSLIERLEGEGRNNLEGLIRSLVDEVIKETDSLLANELVAVKQGDLRDASVISYKRAEVLEKAIKAVQAKQIFEKENGIDVNSPSMLVVFKFFMAKVKDVFDQMNTDDEMSDTFFRYLAATLGEWKKELKDELSDLDKLDG